MLTALGLAVVVLLLPAPATAQEPGVSVDPNSPAGVEYDVPLAKARREAAGRSEGPGPDGARSPGSQPLFGVGIVEAAGGSPGSAGARSRSPDAGPGDDGDRREAKGAENGGRRSDRSNAGGTPSPGERSTAAIEAASGGGSQPLLTAGIAAGVLAVGLVLGFGLRRLLRGT